MEKSFHNHYYSQTNPKKQTKQTIKLKTQPKKEVLHIKTFNNNPKENSNKPCYYCEIKQKRRKGD